MPCMGGYEDDSQSQLDEAQCAVKTRDAMLCGVLSFLEERHAEVMKDLIKNFDSVRAGVKIEEIEEWWMDHKKQDAERLRMARRDLAEVIRKSLSFSNRIHARVEAVRKHGVELVQELGVKIPGSVGISIVMEDDNLYGLTYKPLEYGHMEATWTPVDREGKWLNGAFLVDARRAEQSDLANMIRDVFFAGFATKTIGDIPSLRSINNGKSKPKDVVITNVIYLDVSKKRLKETKDDS